MSPFQNLVLLLSEFFNCNRLMRFRVGRAHQFNTTTSPHHNVCQCCSNRCSIMLHNSRTNKSSSSKASLSVASCSILSFWNATLTKMLFSSPLPFLVRILSLPLLRLLARIYSALLLLLNSPSSMKLYSRSVRLIHDCMVSILLSFKSHSVFDVLPCYTTELQHSCQCPSIRSLRPKIFHWKGWTAFTGICCICMVWSIAATTFYHI